MEGAWGVSMEKLLIFYIISNWLWFVWRFYVDRIFIHNKKNIDFINSDRERILNELAKEITVRSQLEHEIYKLKNQKAEEIK